jgi:hypothetical protein
MNVELFRLGRRILDLFKDRHLVAFFQMKEMQ